jgi:ribosomal protein S18 acetylase RimI-like enzyme
MIKHLTWDSEFFGVKIGSYAGALHGAEEQAFLGEVQREQFDCTYVFVDPNDVDTIAAASKNRFLSADTRVEYGLDLKTYRPDPTRQIEFLNPKNEEDVAAVRGIAGSLSGVSRFHFDARFRAKAAEMYELWVDRAVSGSEGKVAIIRSPATGAIAGFVTFTMREMEGELVLVAISEAERGRGLGWKLVDSVNLYLIREGINRIRVKTQLRNTLANRHYQQVGFRVVGASCIYHAWTEDLPLVQ